jgi:hypothetical protein
VGRTCVEDFADDLAHAERSLLTIKNYRGDLMAFATWFRHANGEELTPTHIGVSANHVHGFGRFNLQNAEAGSTPFNRGHAATAVANCMVRLGGRPRRLGATQAGRGT